LAEDPNARYSDYDVWRSIWPSEDTGKPLAPVRVGMDARSGKLMIGFPHVEQSLGKIFSTPYHTRILRQWSGSYVPKVLGRNLQPSTFTAFYWAMAAAVDLWEPCARINRVATRSRADGREMTTPEEIRRGGIIFAHDYTFMPRGHLGDRTPELVRTAGFVGEHDAWEIVDEEISDKDGRIGDHTRRRATMYHLLGWGLP
jgi:phage baseplate assembly protein W